MAMNSVDKSGLIAVLIVGSLLLFAVSMGVYAVATGQDSHSVCERKGGDFIMTDYGGVCVKKGTVL